MWLRQDASGESMRNTGLGDLVFMGTGAFLWASAVSIWYRKDCLGDSWGDWTHTLRCRTHKHPRPPVRVRGGLLSSLGGFVIRIRIPCIAVSYTHLTLPTIYSV